MRFNALYLATTVTGAFISPPPLIYSNANLAHRTLDKRQIPPYPVPPAANDTGNQPCVANHDVYDCASKIMGSYAIQIANNTQSYPMKVKVNMYTELNDTTERNGYASGSIDVDARLSPKTCSLSGPTTTYRGEGFVCSNQACVQTFQFSHLQRQTTTWGQKWTAELSVTVTAKIEAWFVADYEVSTTAKAAYENSESQELVNETTTMQSEQYYLSNGQVCIPTTIQMQAQCVIIAELPVTKLFQWTSDDGLSKKLVYCGSPNAPDNLNPEFAQFCGEVGHPKNVTIWLANSDGSPTTVKGCSYGLNQDVKMDQ